MHKAVFLDRDGTITRDNHSGYYTYKLEDYGLIPGVIEALQELAKEYKLIIVTNQGSIAKGLVKLEEYHTFSKHMEADLAAYGVKFDGIYFCPHRPPISECECRKPKPGMILQAAKKHNIDLKKSWMVGDSLSDMLAGQSAGCTSILVKSGSGKTDQSDMSFVKPDYIAEDLLEASKIILK